MISLLFFQLERTGPNQKNQQLINQLEVSLLCDPVAASTKGFRRIQLAPEDPLTGYHWHSSAGFDGKGFPACLQPMLVVPKIAEAKTQADSKEKNSAELG